MTGRKADYQEFSNWAQGHMHTRRSERHQQGRRESPKLKTLLAKKRKLLRSLNSFKSKLQHVLSQIDVMCPHLPEHNGLTYWQDPHRSSPGTRYQLSCTRCQKILDTYFIDEKEEMRALG